MANVLLVFVLFFGLDTVSPIRLHQLQSLRKTSNAGQANRQVYEEVERVANNSGHLAHHLEDLPGTVTYRPISREKLKATGRLVEAAPVYSDGRSYAPSQVPPPRSTAGAQASIFSREELIRSGRLVEAAPIYSDGRSYAPSQVPPPRSTARTQAPTVGPSRVPYDVPLGDPNSVPSQPWTSTSRPSEVPPQRSTDTPQQGKVFLPGDDGYVYIVKYEAAAISANDRVMSMEAIDYDKSGRLPMYSLGTVSRSGGVLWDGTELPGVVHPHQIVKIISIERTPFLSSPPNYASRGNTSANGAKFNRKDAPEPEEIPKANGSTFTGNKASMSEERALEILGIPGPRPDREALKKAHRKMALKWHPDKSTDNKAKDKFQEVQAAFELVTELLEHNGKDHLSTSTFKR